MIHKTPFLNHFHKLQSYDWGESMINNNSIQLELRKFVAPEYIFGVDAKKLAAKYCLNFGGNKVLLVTDKIVMSQNWFNEILTNLNENQIDYHIFSNISPNPRDYEVAEGASVFKATESNIILAVGGGSVIDCAKGIGIVSTNNRSIEHFEGIDRITSPIPPLICIPTTSGTSADVSQFAIINNYSKKYKMAIISKALVPDIALIDPLVLMTMDNYLTACTGMDALSHAVEAFVSNANSPFTDLYALESIKLIDENLLYSIKNPNEIQARAKVMLASLYAGLAFSNASLGCVHSLAHSLGGYLDLAHGECNAILLPHVVNYNFESSTDRYKKISTVLKINKGSNTKKEITNYLFNLNSQLGIKDSLNDKGVSSDIISTLSKKAINDPCNATNPRPPVKKDLETIYSEAL